MSAPTLDISPDLGGFVLSGDIAGIASNRRMRLQLEDAVGARFQDSTILIPFLPGAREETLLALNRILARAGLVPQSTARIQSILSTHYEEERNFESFSKLAADIRNNILDAAHLAEFRNFADVLEEKMPRRLYGLQLLSAYHMAFSQNSCNFSVPGSGKTSIVYAAYSYLKSLPTEHNKHVNRLVIIGPLSSFGPWENEHEACFNRKAISRRLSGGATREERALHFYSSNPAEITLVSYQGVVNMIDEMKDFLRRFRAMVVLDEAHRIKNASGGITAQAVLSLAPLCRSRIVLTGTPAPNGYEDVYNLFKFIWPMKRVTYYHLHQLEQMSSNPHDTRIPELISHLSPYFIRIKKEHLGIPQPVEHPPTAVEMGPLQAEIYRRIARSTIRALTSAGRGRLENRLAKARVIRLMQASTNPALLAEPIDEYLRDGPVGDSPLDEDIELAAKVAECQKSEIPAKFQVAANLVESIIRSGGKAVIWATFVRNIEQLHEFFTQRGIRCERLYGATPVETNEMEDLGETREGIIREFHRDGSNLHVLIANPFAVGESISLHKVCHHAIYLERTFNAAHFIQSKDRIHRYGLRPDDVTNYHYLLSDRTIDAVVHSRLQLKERRLMQIIEGEEIPLFARYLSDQDDDDLKAIIDAYTDSRS